MAIIRIQGVEEAAARIYYEVDSDEKELGTGGMGQVRRGIRVDTTNGLRSEVAIKFLFDDLPPSTIERARREASIRIHNDNVVNMLGFIETEENGIKRYHVVSELLRGVMLYDVLNGTYTDSEGRPVELAQKLIALRSNNPEVFAMTVMKGVLSGVMALHDNGYVHRDIDPSNVMITSNGKIKLLDFGLAQQLDPAAVPEHQNTTACVFM
ncbi:MAG: protein kinase, partial [Muribaculaceae bacterium]|nr:protein kinase [Muribaculaceae bacterium]